MGAATMVATILGTRQFDSHRALVPAKQRLQAVTLSVDAGVRSKTNIKIDSSSSARIPSHLEEIHVTGAGTPQMSAGLSRPTRLE